MSLNSFGEQWIAVAVLGIYDYATPNCHVRNGNGDRHMQPECFAGIFFGAQATVALNLRLFHAIHAGPADQAAQKDAPEHVASINVELGIEPDQSTAFFHSPEWFGKGAKVDHTGHDHHQQAQHHEHTLDHIGPDHRLDSALCN